MKNLKVGQKVMILKHSRRRRNPRSLNYEAEIKIYEGGQTTSITDIVIHRHGDFFVRTIITPLGAFYEEEVKPLTKK
jgi:hypothetical protein